ncbi:MAG: hypothetical protein GWP10_13365 [Nitrospiraceae bacterium]|nr:hypothetical protein [Nitrospiraceae bacterium]
MIKNKIKKKIDIILNNIITKLLFIFIVTFLLNYLVATMVFNNTGCEMPTLRLWTGILFGILASALSYFSNEDSKGDKHGIKKY